MIVKHKKAIKKIGIVFLSLLICRGVTHLFIQNIFDEIYMYQSSPLLPGIEYLSHIRYRVKGEDMTGWVRRSYYEDFLPDSVLSIGIYFNFSRKKISFNIDHIFDDEEKITISYDYYKDTKALYKEIYYYDEAKYEIIRSKEKVSDYLQKQGSSIEEIADLGDSVLQEIILSDWCSFTFSRYRPDHWGKIKVEEK